jgi:hypothetical protein
VASKSAYRDSEKGADVENALEELEQLIDRVKALYEQYFLGMQKQAPAFLHTDCERKIRDLTQLQIRNTALRYRFTMLQQKFSSYSAYWKRSLRQIENGTHARTLTRVGRKALETGQEVPPEILANMPKHMREAIRRERALALSRKLSSDDADELSLDDADAAAEFGDDATTGVASRVADRPRPAPAAAPPPGKDARGAFVLDPADASDDLESMFAAIADQRHGTLPPSMRKIPRGDNPIPVAAASPPPGVVAAVAASSAAAAVAAAVRAAAVPTSAPAPFTAPTGGPSGGSGQPTIIPPSAARALTRPLTMPPINGAGAPSRPSQPDLGAAIARPRTVTFQPPDPANPPSIPEVPVRLRRSSNSIPLPMGPMPTAPGIAPTRPQSGPLPPGIPPTRPQSGPLPPGIPAAARARAAGDPLVPPPPPPVPPRRPGVAASPPSTPHRPAPPAPPSPPSAPPTPAAVARPRPADAAPASAATRPAAQGMSEAEVRALHATYVKAKEMVGEAPDANSYAKLVKTINQQAPKIMEQYNAKGVEFTVVVKDKQVVIRAKPKA